jgi:hypothetical protein
MSQWSESCFCNEQFPILNVSPLPVVFHCDHCINLFSASSKLPAEPEMQPTGWVNYRNQYRTVIAVYCSVFQQEWYYNVNWENSEKVLRAAYFWTFTNQWHSPHTTLNLPKNIFGNTIRLRVIKMTDTSLYVHAGKSYPQIVGGIQLLGEGNAPYPIRSRGMSWEFVYYMTRL